MDIEYRVYIKTPQHKYKSHKMDMLSAIKYVADYLDNIQAIDCLDKGHWVYTEFVLIENITFCKRYIIELNIPYTKITIKKENKGSIDTELFTTALKFIKEKYYERI